MFHVKQNEIHIDKNLETIVETKDFMVSGEVFNIVKRKGQSYLETQPVPENLDSYYESNTYISHTDAKDNLFARIYQLVKKFTLKQKVLTLSKPKIGENKLLDLGAGTGDFLAAAQKKGWQVSGIEPNLRAQKLAIEKGINLLPSFDEIGNQKFDVISLWHVLEHIPDLDTCLLELDRLLKPGGLLIIAVPNYKSWDAIKYGKFWAAYDTPRHLWHFDRQAMQFLFPKTFLLKKTKPMWFDAFYVSLLSEKYQTGKTNWLKGGINGLVSNLRAIFTKEYSSVVYFYRKNNA